MMLYHPIHRLARFLPLSGGLLLGMLLAVSDAQVPSAITPDGTMGTVVTLDGRVFGITGGTRPGQGPNLFHSFGQFNVGTGDTAHFVGQQGIENIIGRVTGGSGSLIDGLLQSDASLFLLNPSGLMFGPNAILDVNGSIHASTADVLRFADGAAFSAHLNEKSTLTVAAPTAFGFLSENPAGITIEGSRFEVPDGETISLVGGDIKIVGRPSVGDGPPTVSAPSGQINLVSVMSPGSVTISSPKHILTVTVDKVERLGVIDVSQTALLSVSGNGGGTVVIRGGRLLVDNAHIFANTTGGSHGASSGIDLVATEEMILRDGALVTTDVLGAGTAGNIEVTVPSLEVTTGAVLGSRALAGSTGDTGNIAIRAEQLRVTDGGQLSTNTYAQGNAGSVEVKASNLRIDGQGSPQFTGIFSDTYNSSGDAGTVTVTVEGLVELLNGVQITSSTYTQGNAGDVEVTAGDLRIDGQGSPQFTGIFSDTANSGDAGTVTVTVEGLVELLNWGQISSNTYAQGNAGSVEVKASNLRIDSQGSPRLTGIFSDTYNSSGDAGTVRVAAAGLVELFNGGQISSNTYAQGNAGSVEVKASNLRIDDQGSPQFTGIASQAGQNSSGNAGTVRVAAAGLVELFNGGQISSSTFAQGDAGSVEVKASNLRIDDQGSPQFTGIASQAGQNSSGNAGTVRVAAAGLVELLNGGVITSSTFAQGDAGGVEVQASNLRIDGQGSPQFTGIFSDTYNSSGDAGTVTVTVEGLVELLNGVQITSSTYTQGNAGDVEVTAGDLRIDGQGSPQFTGIFSDTANSGDAGTVTVTVEGLVELLNWGQISSNTYAQGNAGSVKVKASNLRIDDQGSPRLTGIFSDTYNSSGDAGTVRVAAAGLVELFNGGQISSNTYAQGNAGSVEVKASNLRIDDQGSPQFTGIASQAGQNSSGNAGTVRVAAAGLVELLNGGVITSSTFAQGDAGGVEVQASNLRIDGQGSPQFTGIFSDTYNSSGDAGTVTVTVEGLVELLNGVQITSSTYTQGNAGDVEVTAGDLRIDGQGSPQFTGIFSDTANSGDAGTVTVTVEGLVELLNWGQISSNTYAQGDAGSVEVKASNLRIDSQGSPRLTGIFSDTYNSSGDAGTVRVAAAGLVELFNGGQISSNTYAQGNAGSVEVKASNLRIDDQGSPQFTGIASQAGQNSSGNAGTVRVAAAGLVELLNGGVITSSTFAQGDAGGVEVQASNLRIDGQGSPQFTGIFSDTYNSSGDAGTVTVTVEGLVELLNGVQITSSTYTQGNAGDVEVTAGDLRIDGQGSPQFTGIFSDTANSGDAGTVTVTVEGLVELLNWGQISSNTYAQGNAGSVKVKASNLRIDSQGSPRLTGIFSDTYNSSGDAGTVRVAAAGLVELFNGGQISSNTYAQGDAGSVEVKASNLRIDDQGSPQFTGIASLATRDATGLVGNVEVEAGTVTLLNGGTISIEARQTLPENQLTGPIETLLLISADHLHLDGEASITAESTGNVPASTVEIHARDLLMEGASRITTTSSEADGGDIQITAYNLIRLQDSQITTAVGTGGGAGGNITIDPEFAVLANSQITADAFGGPGGNIDITAEVLLADSTRPSQVTASSAQNIDGVINIQSPVTDISDTITPPQATFVSTAVLLRDRCAAQLQEGTVSSLVARGRASVPATPEGLLPSRLYQPDQAPAASPKTEQQPAETDAPQQEMLAETSLGKPHIISRPFPAHAPVAPTCNWSKP